MNTLMQKRFFILFIFSTLAFTSPIFSEIKTREDAESFLNTYCISIVNEIEKLLNKNKDCEKIEVCGSAGDIILANTTYIHRGKVIEEGIRKAMTEYFF